CVGTGVLLCETLTGAGVGPKLNLLSPPQSKAKKPRGAYAFQRIFRKKESNPLRVCLCSCGGVCGSRLVGGVQWLEHDNDVVADREYQGNADRPAELRVSERIV